jgi:hypothetical protein
VGWSEFERGLGVERVFQGRGGDGMVIAGLGGAGCKEE